MFEEIKYFVGGLIIGAGLALMIQFWINFFLFRLNDEIKKNNSFHENQKNNSRDWLFILGFSIFIGFIAAWRQITPYFLNDIILVSTLIIIAKIDLKTMLIEGRIIAFSLIIRLVWLIYFEPQEILNYFSGLFFRGFGSCTFLAKSGIF